MATLHTGQTQPSIDLEEHRSVAGVNAKAVILYGWNGTSPVPLAADVSGILSTSGGGGSSSTAYITQFYTDATYTYVCKSLPGTSLSATSWQVFRYDSSNNIRYAGGSAGFTNAATDLPTVQAYSYS